MNFEFSNTLLIWKMKQQKIQIFDYSLQCFSLYLPQHSWHNMISILLLDSSILYIAKQIDFSEKYLAYDFVTSAKIQCLHVLHI